MLDPETEFKKGFKQAVRRIVGWIPYDLSAFAQSNLTILTQRVDNVGIIIDRIEENLEEFRDSLKMDPTFYKYRSTQTTSL